jgi:hypothetical protein
MFRLVVLLSFAALSLLPSCVDLNSPAKVSQCEKDGTCVNGSGGKGGATAGAGGTTSRPTDAGVIDAPLGGKAGSGGGTGGGAGGQGGGGTAGSKGGTTTSGGSTAGSTTGGTDGGAGGTGGSSDAGTEPATDGPVDKPLETPDVPVDTNSKVDVTPPDAKILPEVTPPDVTPDVTPDRQPPDTGFDAPSCIQTFKTNGYSVPVSTDAGVNSCTECRENGTSKEAACKAFVDCLATVWVCNSPNASCWITCRNNTPGGDMVVNDCVVTLINKTCP